MMADYAVLPLMGLSLALVVIGLNRRSAAKTAGGDDCRGQPGRNAGGKS